MAVTVKAALVREHRLRTALDEIYRRTGLLLHQNTGRWGKTEYEKRAKDVLETNQQIAFKALEK